MKLNQYLKENNLKTSDLARSVEVQHTVALRWVKEKRVPSPENMQKIFAFTHGEVTPNDFYNIDNGENNGEQ